MNGRDAAPNQRCTQLGQCEQKKSTITAIHFIALLICQKQVKRLLLANESCTRFVTAIVQITQKKARVNVKLVAYWNQSTNKIVHHVYVHLEH